MGRTIPEPTQSEFSTALKGIRRQAKAHKVDLSIESNVLFINHLAEVQAQMMAETRYLRQFLLPENMRKGA